MSNEYKTVFYTGITNNIQKRATEHREGVGSAFTTKYNCKYLVYYETYNDVMLAIEREKQLKNWKREWKIELINKINPDLNDLAEMWW